MKILIPIDNFIKCDFEMYLSVLMQVKALLKLGIRHINLLIQYIFLKKRSLKLGIRFPKNRYYCLVYRLTNIKCNK